MNFVGVEPWSAVPRPPDPPPLLTHTPYPTTPLLSHLRVRPSKINQMGGKGGRIGVIKDKTENKHL